MLTSRWGQVIAAILVLILGATGYASLSNAISLDKINQALAGLEAQGASTAVPDQSGGGVVEGESDEAGAALSGQVQSEVLLFPTISDTLVLSPDALAFQVRLHNPLTETSASLAVQLFIVQAEDGTPLSPGLASQAAQSGALEAEQTISLAVQFAADTQLPASGEYRGWLLVSSEQLTPISRPVSVFISRPGAAIQYRLSAADSPAVVISGVRLAPCFWKQVCDAGWNFNWQPYQLSLWEQNLQSVSYVLLPSELANQVSGETGRLEISAPAGQTNLDAPTAVTLKVSDIRSPGVYQGTLTILFPETRQQETLAVTAQLRDMLLWPFLVIALGAGLAGWLLRVGTRARESVNFQKVVLRMIQGRLRSLPFKPEHQARRKAEQKLLEAELTLRLGDVARAVVLLDEVSADVARLEDGWQKLNQAQQLTGQQMKAPAAREKPAGREPAGPAEPVEALEGLMKDAPRLLNQAHISLARGELSNLDKNLDQLSAALSASLTPAAETLESLGDEGLERAVDSGWRSCAIRGQLKSDAAGGAMVVAPARLLTGQEVTFWVQGAAPGQLFNWQVHWFSPSGEQPLAGSEAPAATFSFTPQAEPLDEYPRRCRLTAQAEGGPTLGLDFEISLPFAIQAQPGRLVNIGEGLWLELDPPLSVQDAPPTWHVIRPGDKEPRKLGALPYFPTLEGEHRFLANQAGQWVAAAVVQVRPNLLDLELKRYQWAATLSTLGWAAVAGISGLVYISAQLNAFGAGLDYLLAFAGGLGVGAAAAPKEGMKEAVQKALGISPAPPAPPPPPVITTDSGEKTIPNFSKLTWAEAMVEAAKEGLGLNPDVQNPRDDQKIIDQKPKPGKAQGITQVDVFLDQDTEREG